MRAERLLRHWSPYVDALRVAIALLFGVSQSSSSLLNTGSIGKKFVRNDYATSYVTSRKAS